MRCATEASAFATITAATAAAGPGADVPVLHTLGDICYGQGQVNASAVGSQRGTTRLWINFAKWTPTFGNPCSVSIFTHWRNLDTGGEGTVRFPKTDSSTSFTPNPPTVSSVPTGSGRVTFTASTDRPHLPVGTVQIQVP